MKVWNRKLKRTQWLMINENKIKYNEKALNCIGTRLNIKHGVEKLIWCNLIKYKKVHTNVFELYRYTFKYKYVVEKLICGNQIKFKLSAHAPLRVLTWKEIALYFEDTYLW